MGWSGVDCGDAVGCYEDGYFGGDRIAAKAAASRRTPRVILGAGASNQLQLSVCTKANGMACASNGMLLYDSGTSFFRG